MSWLLVVGVLVALVIYLFNRLVALRNRAQGAWSDIDVQLKRRHDLVGNLVETVKAYAKHERQTLEEVVLARTEAEGARVEGSPQRAGEAATALGGRLRSLFAVAEAYPDLKASESFLELQRGLTQVENDVQQARRYYNAVVRDLNTRIQSFPDVIVARVLAFQEREFFQLERPEEAMAPRIDLETER